MADTITSIPSARARFLKEDGTIETVWFRFFSNLFTLLGSGSAATVTVEDLLVGPSDVPVTVGDINEAIQQAMLSAIVPQDQAVPRQALEPFPQIDVTYLQTQIDSLSLSPVVQPQLPVTAATYTAGSILFAGSSGAPTQDNSNFFFDDTNNRMAVGSNDTTSGTNAAINAVSSTTTAIKFQGNTTGVKGILYSDATNIGVLDTTGNNGLLVTPGTSLDLRTGSSTPRLTVSNTGDVTINTHDLIINTAGKGLKVKEGSNAKMGRAVLVGGTVTVSTTAVASTSEIFITNRITGGGLGSLSIGTVTAGTSFVINSTNILDTSTICWLIVDPA